MRVSSQVTATVFALAATVLPAAAQAVGANSYIQTNLVPAPPVAHPSSTRTCWIRGHRDQYLEPVLDIEPSFRNGNCVQRFGRQIVNRGQDSAGIRLGRRRARETDRQFRYLIDLRAPVPGAVYTFQTLNNSGDAAFNQLLASTMPA